MYRALQSYATHTSRDFRLPRLSVNVMPVESPLILHWPFLVVTEGKFPSLAEKTAVLFLSISIDEPSEKENVATFFISSHPRNKRGE